MRVLLLGLFCQKRRFSIIVFLFLPFFIQAQNIKIVDENRNLIEGVLMYSDDKKITKSSDGKGQIIVDNIMKNTYLNFKAIGYLKVRKQYSDIIEENGIVVLESNDELLEKIVIIGRNEQYLDDIIPETNIISSKDIQVVNSQSAADALAMSGNVFVQKSQFGGGSPVLRGFEANRVLLVLDGVRMNNAIYRNGHLQNSITVDNFALKRMEVVFGPGSLTYGSDAIGGVIHFKTKDPDFGSNYLNYKMRYSSAANEKTGYLSYNFHKNKFASLSIFSFSDFDDLKAGNNRPEKYQEFGKRNEYVKVIDRIDSLVKNEDYNVQVGTGYSQFNLLNKSIYKFNDKTKFTSNIQFSTSSNVPRYDFLTEKKGSIYKYSKWYYGPQTRLLGSLRMDLCKVNKFYDNAVIIAAMQKINEDRISRKFSNNWKVFNEERLFVFSISADFKKYIKHNKNHELVYGLDYQDNNLNSSAYRENITTGNIKFDVLSRYPSDFARNYRGGMYMQYIFGEKDYPYQISLGTRVETNSIEVKYAKSGIINWPDLYYKGVKNNNFSYAMSFGTKYKFPKKWSVSANLSTAFRNPNIDDLAKIRVKKGEFLVPNLNLETENSYNGELSLNKKIILSALNIKFRATGFYTILNNAIVRKEFALPDGKEIYIDGNDTLKIMANQNAEKEKVFGFSLGLNSSFKSFSISSNIVFTKGDLYENNINIGPASHIPPLFGNIKINYLFDKVNIKYVISFNGEKPIELYGGSVDNPENATIDGTYAWIAHNLYFNYRLKNSIVIDFGIENIFDKHYRTFSSGVSAPGRNLVLSFSGRL